jgi:SAM-dependent methyltransferase
VIACGVLEHIPDAGDAVSEIARILRDEGRLMLTTSHTNSIVYLERRIREALRLWPYGYQRNCRAAELQRLLEPSFEATVIESAQTAWDFPFAAVGDRIIGACTERPWGRYLTASCERV